jgi:hypothetical protein
MKTHSLKTLNPYFAQVCVGEKTAELRLDDRGFEVGDTLRLQEWSEESDYTGTVCFVTVTDVCVYEPALKPGWVMLSFQVLSVERPGE